MNPDKPGHRSQRLLLWSKRKHVQRCLRLGTRLLHMHPREVGMQLQLAMCKRYRTWPLPALEIAERDDGRELMAALAPDLNAMVAASLDAKFLFGPSHRAQLRAALVRSLPWVKKDPFAMAQALSYPLAWRDLNPSFLQKCRADLRLRPARAASERRPRTRRCIGRSPQNRRCHDSRRSVDGNLLSDARVRNALRCTAAHNTSSVDGPDQADMFATFKWVNPMRTRLLESSTDRHFDYAHAMHNGYARLRKPVLHWRSVLSVKPWDGSLWTG